MNIEISKFFGKYQIANDTIFDIHLLFLMIPFFLIAMILFFRKKISNAKTSTKNIMLANIGIILFLTFCLSFLEFKNNLKFEKNEIVNFASSFAIFNNLDVFLSLIICLSLITKRYGIVRMFIPFGIVIGLTRMINNPGQTISGINIINDIALISLPLSIIFITNKTISVKSFVFSSILNISLLIYLLILNEFAGTYYSTISTMALDKNPIYNVFKFKFLQVIIFIIMTLAFEFIVWIFIRYSFNFIQVSSKIGFWNSFKYEVVNEYLILKKHSDYIKENSLVKVEKLDVENHFAENSVHIKLKNENFLFIFLKTLFVFKEKIVEKFLIPISIISTRNSNGTRAPSF